LLEYFNPSNSSVKYTAVIYGGIISYHWHLEGEVDDGEIKIRDRGPPHDVDEDVFEAGTDVVIDGGDDGVGADDGATEDAGILVSTL
jgi:hypothetical protein